jgi:hypothetical protein
LDPTHHWPARLPSPECNATAGPHVGHG